MAWKPTAVDREDLVPLAVFGPPALIVFSLAGAEAWQEHRLATHQEDLRNIVAAGDEIDRDNPIVLAEEDVNAVMGVIAGLEEERDRQQVSALLRNLPQTNRGGLAVDGMDYRSMLAAVDGHDRIHLGEAILGAGTYADASVEYALQGGPMELTGHGYDLLMEMVLGIDSERQRRRMSEIIHDGLAPGAPLVIDAAMIDRLTGVCPQGDRADLSRALHAAIKHALRRDAVYEITESDYIAAMNEVIQVKDRREREALYGMLHANQEKDSDPIRLTGYQLEEFARRLGRALSSDAAEEPGEIPHWAADRGSEPAPLC